MVIEKVQKEKAAAAIKAVEAPNFAAVTMVKVQEILPSAGAGICASCVYANDNISYLCHPLQNLLPQQGRLLLQVHLSYGQS
jgi:hypothetical protein